MSENVFKDLDLDVYHEIKAERRRQIEVEGFDHAHDDEHANGEIALAGAAYALYAGSRGWPYAMMPCSFGHPPSWWPWSFGWWKPKLQRDNLIKAAALIVAEIERLDRLEARKEVA